MTLAKPSQAMLDAGIAVWYEFKDDPNLYPDIIDVVRRIYQVMEAARIVARRRLEEIGDGSEED